MARALLGGARQNLGRTTMKLAHSLAPLFVAVLGGCTSLGAYGGMLAQPGTAGAPAAGTPGAGAGAPGAGSPAAVSPAPEAPPNAASKSETPSAPTTVSVTIRNKCSKTVKLFYGDKPKFGSGTYSSASSNSVQSHTFRPGDQLWLVDDSQNGLANVQVGPSTREIEIGSSCGGLVQR
jgi:nucleoid-associated protein YgaU